MEPSAASNVTVEEWSNETEATPGPTIKSINETSINQQLIPAVSGIAIAKVGHIHTHTHSHTLTHSQVEESDSEGSSGDEEEGYPYGHQRCFLYQTQMLEYGPLLLL